VQHPAGGNWEVTLMPEQYYFNLTDGEQVIHDEDGVQASDLRSAMLSAVEALEELGSEIASSGSWHLPWQGWRLEIVDGSGRSLQSIPLARLVESGVPH